jgi:hypothetical protein
MHQYIKIDGKWIYAHAIVSLEYDNKVEVDGDLIDHEPVAIPVDESTLVIRLANGDEIKKTGSDASYFFHLLYNVSIEITKPE